MTPSPPAVDGGSDVARRPVAPLRSVLRSTDPKITNSDVVVPSKPDRNHSATAAVAAADKSGRKFGGELAAVDRKDIPMDLSAESQQQGVGGGSAPVDGTGGGGTTLSDLKRQRAQSRRPPDNIPSAHQSSSAEKSTTSSVRNGDVPTGDHEPRLRLTSPELVTVEEKREQRCCVLF